MLGIRHEVFIGSLVWPHYEYKKFKYIRLKVQSRQESFRCCRRDEARSNRALSWCSSAIHKRWDTEYTTLLLDFNALSPAWVNQTSNVCKKYKQPGRHPVKISLIYRSVVARSKKFFLEGEEKRTTDTKKKKKKRNNNNTTEKRVHRKVIARSLSCHDVKFHNMPRKERVRQWNVSYLYAQIHTRGRI